MRLTNDILDLLVQRKWLDSIIVGPYATEKHIQSKVYMYNKTRKTNIRVTQKRLLLVDPETLETKRVWRVKLIERGGGVV